MGLRARPSGIGARLRSILGAGSPATDATWDEVEEALIAADVGATTTLELVDAARERVRSDGGRTGEDARRALATEIRDRLVSVGSGQFELGRAPVGRPLRRRQRHRQDDDDRQARRAPHGGRAGAWRSPPPTRSAPPPSSSCGSGASSSGVPVVAQRAGADPGAVAFDAVAAAESRGLDAVLVDTAGRLQNKQQLMDELAKIRRVIERRLPGPAAARAPRAGRHDRAERPAQAEAFSREAGVTGIVLTKLDGTAKGGVALAAADRLGVPILFAGVGEEIDALAPFDPEAFVEWLFAD